jgi:hypothetical protein
MSTPALPFEGELLGNLPQSLRDELLDAYNSIVRNYREGHWEPSELNGGKLCEVVYTILLGIADGNFPGKASKPTNMVDACRSLEQAPSTLPRSVRIQIPRMLVALYEIRSNRGVGHTGGDVGPNRMDATCVVYMSKWVVAELVRVLHRIDTLTAERAVDAIVERIVPVVWKVAGKLRVLDTKTSMEEKTLILLYSNPAPVAAKQLFEWLEHSNATVYRNDVLQKLHDARLIEYDKESGTVHLSPTGTTRVEKEILPGLEATG